MHRGIQETHAGWKDSAERAVACKSDLNDPGLLADSLHEQVKKAHNFLAIESGAGQETRVQREE